MSIMFLIVFILLFVFLPGCRPHSAYPSLSPSGVAVEPSGNAPATPPYLPSPYPAATFQVPSGAKPNLAFEPVSSPAPGLEILSPLAENAEEQQPANTASPTPAAPVSSHSPALSVSSNPEVPESYRGKRNPYTWNDAKTKESGKTIFNELCQGCHGPAGNLQKSADFTSPAISARIKDFPDYFFWGVSEGKKTASGFSMPAFKGLLNEEERWQVITYIQSLGSR